MFLTKSSIILPSITSFYYPQFKLFQSTYKKYSNIYHTDSLPNPSRNLPINYGIRLVPQQVAWVIERFGKFHNILEPGLHFLIPVVDKIAYVHGLKEQAIAIPHQNAITKDNVTITIDGVLYLKVIDPYKASYGVENPFYAITQLAQTTMRSELGKITLDKTFEERENLNIAIVHVINEAAKNWGLRCMRYEIRDITPPNTVKAAMDMQAEAERRKRAAILDSEGKQQSEINIATGNRKSLILNAEGDAQSIVLKAKATARGIQQIAAVSNTKEGKDAISFRIAEQYIYAFGNLAKETNTLLLPSDTNNISSMVATSLSLYNKISNKHNVLNTTEKYENKENTEIKENINNINEEDLLKNEEERILQDLEKNFENFNDKI